MTAKRFKLGYVCGDYGLIDNDKWIDLHSMSENSEKNVRICINKMNDLAEENKQLKTTIQQLRTDNTKQKKKLNTTMKENEELKEDNDIKFWKHELMIQWNKTQIISHELSLAIENGYEISEDFKKYLDELKERHEENMKKAERLKI